MATPTTTAELRARLDGGRAGDKVDFPDPSAAPLGTDDEAAGTPASQDDIALAAAHELGHPPADRPHDTGERHRAAHEDQGLPLWIWIAVALLVVGGIVFALLAV